MFKAIFSTVALTVTLAAATPAEARSGWEHLGSRTVRLVADRDVIPVRAYEGQFRKLQLRVRENGVFINSLNVIYSNGAYDQIPISYHIGRGERTRVIDLRGGDRFIRRIDIYYRAVRNGRGRAVVDVYGRH